MRLLVLFFFFLPTYAWAQQSDYGCTIPPSQINSWATSIITKYHNQNQSLPNNVIKFFQQSGVFDGNKFKWVGTAEGLVRPLDSPDHHGIYYPLPIPIITVLLTRSEDLAYFCAHADANPALEHLTIYFMDGQGLDPGFNLFDIISSPGAEIAPVDLAVNGVPQLTNEVEWLLGPIPLVNILAHLSLGSISAITEDLVTTFANAINRFTGAGVERLVLTDYDVTLQSGIDLEHPDHATTSICVNLTSNAPCSPHKPATN